MIRPKENCDEKATSLQIAFYCPPRLEEGENTAHLRGMGVRKGAAADGSAELERNGRDCFIIPPEVL